MPFTTPAALRARATAILTDLCIKKNFDAMPTLMAPNVQVIHDDDPPLIGRDEFISHWKQALTYLPGFNIEIGDQVAEVNEESGGGKVWSLSKVNGLPGGKQKETVDMLEIDSEGKVVKIKDVQREIAC
ncbi:hypothetical protein H2200_005076 [Cladophialophora chaetospira]|uniref:SnoaL-like domain-containing protein n=1 Tax=Cladophialophora chaetospira TaxID=386627 RepID=A0AA38XBE0_9EURO|nr:hypothetical protein H2200_005076 [Cladophialophora chaetospira]